MTASVLKERRHTKCKEDEVWDEYLVVQKHLRIFLDDIIVIASEIVCGESGLYQASSSSSTEEPQPSLKVEREWQYKIDVISSKAPLLMTEQNRAAKTTVLDLSSISKPGVKKAIAQGGYQMLGNIQRLGHLVGRVESYSSMLTNGLAWLHLWRTQTNIGDVWMHSPPISVVKKNKKKDQVDSDGIEMVVENILYMLFTAKTLLQEMVSTLGTNQQKKRNKHEKDEEGSEDEGDVDNNGSHQKKKALREGRPSSSS
eukprot:gene36207-47086_t